MAKWLLLALAAAALACAGGAGLLRKEPQVYSFLDFPVVRLYTETDKYVGKVFEDTFKFYRIHYDTGSSALPEDPEGVERKIRFSARPVNQSVYTLQVQVTSQQEQQLSKIDIKQRNAVSARIRFLGKSAKGYLDFELLDLLSETEQVPAPTPATP